MMFYHLVVMAMATVSLVEAYNSLEFLPQPMSNIQLPRLMGQWFSVYRMPPYSWTMSKEFVGFRTFYKFEGPNSISIRFTWARSGYCNQMIGVLTFTPVPGVLQLKDGIGDNLSGKVVVIATDYKEFFILWGCTRFSKYDDKCDDPFLTVQTRVSKPSTKTIAAINFVLLKKFGMTTNSLIPMLHTGECFA